MQSKRRKSFTSNKILDIVRPIYGWLDESEAIYLNQIANLAVKESGPDDVLIEIGSFVGRSTVAIAMACKDNNKGIVITIDPHKNTDTHRREGISDSFRMLKKNLVESKVDKFVEPIKATSEDFFYSFNKKARLLFIDGDHEYDAVLKDFNLWSQKLVDGGYLLLHDTINLNGPRKVLVQLLINSQYEYWDNMGDTACFRKKRRISLKNKLKKIYFIVALKLFFVIYKPKVS